MLTDIANSARLALLVSQLCFAASYSSAALANSVPRLLLNPEHTFVVGEALTIPLEVSDSDGTALQFELISAPSGARLLGYADGTVLFHWIPTPSAADQTAAVIKVIDAQDKSIFTTSELILSRHSIKPKASNAHRTLNSSKTMPNNSVLPIARANDEDRMRFAAPDYPAIPAQSLVINEQYQMYLDTVDSNGMKVGIVSVDLPSGATISDGQRSTRVLSWIPRADQTGEHNATLIVFNAQAINSRQRIELVFNVRSRRPALTSILPEFSTPDKHTDFKIVPAAAKELVIAEPVAIPVVSTSIAEPRAIDSVKVAPAVIRNATLLPTYLTDPDYKIGESR